MSCVVDIDEEPAGDLAARVTVLHAVRQHLRDLCELQASTLLGRKAVADFLTYAHTRPAPEPGAARQPVDQTRWLAERWAAQLEIVSALDDRDDLFPAHTRGILTRLLDSLRGWQSADEHVICRWFDEARRRTGDVYGDPQVSRSRLEIAHLNRHPGAGNVMADPYSLTARTTYAADGATVRLLFHLKGFGPETYAAVLRVLIHELVAHVPSGHAGRQPAGRPDPGASNSSTFAEGLMDYAADYFTERWAPAIERDLATAASQHGRRLANVSAWRQPSGRARLIGYAAGEQLAAFFASTGAEPDHARQDAVRLAVELNGTQRSLVDKDHLVSVLCPPFPPDVQQALILWAAGRADADGVVDAAVRKGQRDG